MTYKYIQSTKAKKIIAYSSLAIKEVLKLSLPEDYKKSLMHNMIWKISGANGKDQTQYCSFGVLNNMTNIQFEHIFTIDYLKKRFLKIKVSNKDEFEKIVSLIVSCLVTKEEHSKLSSINNKRSGNNFIGWNRYKACNIDVYDMSYDNPIKCNIDELIEIYKY